MNHSFKTVDQYFPIGKTLKSHGTQGHLRLLIDHPYKSYIKTDLFLFLDQNGSKVPYRINDVEEGAHLVVSLDDVVNKKDSDLLANLEILIPFDKVKARHLRSPKVIKSKWQGYMIVDERSGKRYEIKKVEEFPQQLMAIIQPDQKEILIPLSEQLINDIDSGRKLVHMVIPDGLLDL